MITGSVPASTTQPARIAHARQAIGPPRKLTANPPTQPVKEHQGSPDARGEGWRARGRPGVRDGGVRPHGWGVSGENGDERRRPPAEPGNLQRAQQVERERKKYRRALAEQGPEHPERSDIRRGQESHYHGRGKAPTVERRVRQHPRDRTLSDHKLAGRQIGEVVPAERRPEREILA